MLKMGIIRLLESFLFCVSIKIYHIFFFTIKKCFGFAFRSKMGFILLFTSCYFVSSNILIRLGFFIIKIKVSSNVKFLFFISKIGESKMAFFRVFLLLKCGVLKHTFSYYFFYFLGLLPFQDIFRVFTFITRQ